MKIIFTSLEYKILLMLFTNQKQINYKQLLDKIWDIAGNFVNDNTFNSLYKKNKRKIRRWNFIIKTVRGLGYRIGINMKIFENKI